MADSAIVLTDSGGIQEETTILNVPCLTLRENTERPVTISEGTNRLVDPNAESIVTAYREHLSQQSSTARRPRFWDGKAAERIARIFTDMVP
jgi:UDP-N-acetylglucosamine 2-epimerase (non-hydrolysing)